MLKIGIVGLPNVGKSTLFNALTKKSVLVANYPFATIDPSVGVVAVPDSRLDALTAFSHSTKTIPGAIEFVDIAGLVRGASEGQGLGNQFLSHIREVDAIAEVVRIFDDSDITHVDASVDPVRDIETIDLELALADLSVVEKRLSSIARGAKRGDIDAATEEAALQKLHAVLKEGQAARVVSLTDGTVRAAAENLQLISGKPVLYVLNKKAGGHNLDELRDERWHALEEFLEKEKAVYVAVDANVENELKDLALEDKEQFRRDYGAVDDGLGDLIRAGYRLLDLISFFTAGEDETRAWTIRNGALAPEAGAAIHSDFRDKFIRAEVIACKDLLAAGSYAKAREQGLVRVEGKEYLVKDGDVMEFRHG